MSESKAERSLNLKKDCSSKIPDGGTSSKVCTGNSPTKLSVPLSQHTDESDPKTGIEDNSAFGKQKLEGVKVMEDQNEEESVDSISPIQDSVVLKNRKRKGLARTRMEIKSIMMRIALDVINPNSETNEPWSSTSCSEDSEDNIYSSSENEQSASEVANEDFDKFHEILKGYCDLPESWVVGPVLWDPMKKMKAIIASEMNISSTGSLLLARSVQIFESMITKITVQGSDLTERFPFHAIRSPQDVSRLINKVSTSNICCGVENMDEEDANFFPDAIRRDGDFFSENCSVIVSNSIRSVCRSCVKLFNAIKIYKHRKKRAAEMKTAKLLASQDLKNQSVKSIKSPFGKALYNLLISLTPDEKDRKKMEHLQKAERSNDTAFVSHAMQDIVSKMTFEKDCPDQLPNFSEREACFAIEDRKKFKVPTLSSNSIVLSEQFNSNCDNLHVQNSDDFTLEEGQEYELFGEVDPASVKIVEMMLKESVSPHIQFTKVDDSVMHPLEYRDTSEINIQHSEHIPISIAEVDQSNSQIVEMIPKESVSPLIEIVEVDEDTMQLLENQDKLYEINIQDSEHILIIIAEADQSNAQIVKMIPKRSVSPLIDTIEVDEETMTLLENQNRPGVVLPDSEHQHLNMAEVVPNKHRIVEVMLNGTKSQVEVIEVDENTLTQLDNQENSETVLEGSEHRNINMVDVSSHDRHIVEIKLSGTKSKLEIIEIDEDAMSHLEEQRK